jgi:very-short-patch-repair endonuclease
MTDVERLLWSRIREEQLGRKFVSQFQTGDAVADFACRRAKLVIELDGGQHAAAAEKDAARTRMIEAYGYKVVRFWNSDVMENLDGVLETILIELDIASS